jgi:hypothetical protein
VARERRNVAYVVGRKEAVGHGKEEGSCVVWQGGKKMCCVVNRKESVFCVRRKESVFCGFVVSKEEGKCVVW